MDYTYLLYIAIILIFTKAFGLLSKVIKLPQVVGALVAGIILGPVCLNLVSLDNAPILSNLSEIGVIVLMFAAGLETDIREMKKCGLASSIIALIGVIVPLWSAVPLQRSCSVRQIPHFRHRRSCRMFS